MLYEQPDKTQQSVPPDIATQLDELVAEYGLMPGVDGLIEVLADRRLLVLHAEVRPKEVDENRIHLHLVQTPPKGK